MLTATSAVAYEPPAMKNWHTKAKEKALQLHERTFGGEAFGYGFEEKPGDAMNWARTNKHAKKAFVGNVDFKHLKKLLSGHTTVEWDLDDWGKLSKKRTMLVRHFGSDGKISTCELKMNSKAKITRTRSHLNYWGISGTNGGIGGSSYMFAKSPEDLLRALNDPNEFGYKIMYDRTNGLLATYIYFEPKSYISAGSIQKGIPQFAMDECEIFQQNPNLKVVKDQIVPDFNTHMLDRSTFLKKKIPTLFPQDIVEPLTAEMLYFDLDFDRTKKWPVTMKGN